MKSRFLPDYSCRFRQLAWGLAVVVLQFVSLAVQAQATVWGRLVSFGLHPVSSQSGTAFGLQPRPDGGSTFLCNSAAEMRLGNQSVLPDYTLLSNTPPNNRDAWVVTLNQAGQARRVLRMGLHNGVYIALTASASDSAGNYYFAGEFANRLSIGGVTLQASNPTYSEAFVCKYDTAGQVVWARTLGATQGPSTNPAAFPRQISYVRLDQFGRVHLAGTFSGDMVLGTTAYPNASRQGQLSDDLFTAILDSNGNLLNAHTYGSSSRDYLDGFVVDRQGNEYLALRYTTALYPLAIGTFTPPEPPAFTLAAALVRFDAQGTPRWMQTLVTGGDMIGNLAIDWTGNYLYCALYATTTNSQFGLAIPAAAYQLLRLNSTTGVGRWARPFVTEVFRGWTVDASGTLYTGTNSRANTITTYTPGLSVPAYTVQVPLLLAWTSEGTVQWLTHGLPAPPSLRVGPVQMGPLTLSTNGDLFTHTVSTGPVVLGRDTLVNVFPFPALQTNLWRVRPPLVAASTNLPLHACPGSSFAVPVFVPASSALPATAVLNVQLSDANGLFDVPTIIGASPVAASGNITLQATIPAGTASGTGYRVRVVVANSNIVATGAGMALWIQSQTYVAIASPATVQICQGAPAPTLHGTGGLDATLQWLLNGRAIAGATSPSYTPNQSGTYALQATSTCGVSTSSAVVYTIQPLPVVTLAAFSPTTVTQAPFVLSGGTPVGGTYSGPGVVNGTFNPAVAGLGRHAIRYLFTDAAGCTASAVDTLEVRQSLAATPNQSANQGQLQLYPNPTSGLVQLQVPVRVTERAIVAVTDILGREIYRDLLEVRPTSTLTLNLLTKPSGLYRITVVTGHNQFSSNLMLSN